jgi:hypothetical protein
LVASLDPEVGLTQPQIRAWSDFSPNWYEVVSGLSTRASSPKPGSMPVPSIVDLGEVAHVFAGCTTADAYNLKAEIEDVGTGTGPRLITTGAIDRYASRWGEMTIRYLKGDYDRPRWPQHPRDRGVGRALARQQCAKILVGGLTAVLEAWFDADSNSAGIVQTWCVRPRGEAETASTATLWWLTGILNSAYFSRIFVSRYGAQSMSGRQITIKKADLLAMPVPMPIIACLQRDHGLVTNPFSVHPAALSYSLIIVCQALQRRGPTSGDFPALDKMAHMLAGALYGRRQEECEDDYYWWCGRARVSPVDGDWSSIASTIASIERKEK